MSEVSFVAIPEIARILGVSVPTVRLWVTSGRIAKDGYIKVGRTYRFDVAAVVNHLKNASAESAAPAHTTPSPDQDI